MPTKCVSGQGFLVLQLAFSTALRASSWLSSSSSYAKKGPGGDGREIELQVFDGQQGKRALLDRLKVAAVFISSRGEGRHRHKHQARIGAR